MKKKMYEKPSVEVVKLQASVAMLAGSPIEGQKNGYGDQQPEQNWEYPKE